MEKFYPKPPRNSKLQFFENSPKYSNQLLILYLNETKIRIGIDDAFAGQKIQKTIDIKFVSINFQNFDDVFE